MSSYIKFLKKGEDLNTLCDRFEKLSQLEDLLSDLILENYNELMKYDYFKVDRFSSSKEQALSWLASSPFYIRKVCSKVIERIFKKSINEKKWNILNTVLMITNSNKLGISIRSIEKELDNNYPIEIDLKLLFTLFNLEREKGLDNQSFKIWDSRINIKKKPHRSIILINIYAKFNPEKSLACIKKIDENNLDRPEIKTRQLYLVALKETVINFFDYFNNTPEALFPKISYFTNWAESLKIYWIRELVYDVFEIKKLKNIRTNIVLRKESFFNDLLQPSEQLKEATDKNMGIVLKKAPQIFTEFFEN